MAKMLDFLGIHQIGTTRMALVGLFAALLLPDLILGLKDVSVTIPQAVRRGGNALFICNYDMENDTLYSVKWYKGRREFYRYTPKENPAMKTFPTAAGINVERNLSNQSHVVLLAVPLSISGKFTCEISVEAPSFLTAMVSGEMEVVELPEQLPVVTGIHPRYRIGDLVDGNCSIKFSKPAANLTWTINGVVVPPHHIKMYQIEKYPEHNLESVMNAINFMVTTQHFIKGQMKLKCTATIFNIYKEEVEKYIEEDRPRILASGRSYDMNAYPYEQQQSSGDGIEDHNESYLTYYSAADMSSSAMASGRIFKIRPQRREWRWPFSSSITRYVRRLKSQIENGQLLDVSVLDYYVIIARHWECCENALLCIIVMAGLTLTASALVIFFAIQRGAYGQQWWRFSSNDFLADKTEGGSHPLNVESFNNYIELNTNRMLSSEVHDHRRCSCEHFLLLSPIQEEQLESSRKMLSLNPHLLLMSSSKTQTAPSARSNDVSRPSSSRYHGEHLSKTMTMTTTIMFEEEFHQHHHHHHRHHYRRLSDGTGNSCC